MLEVDTVSIKDCVWNATGILVLKAFEYVFVQRLNSPDDRRSLACHPVLSTIVLSELSMKPARTLTRLVLVTSFFSVVSKLVASMFVVQETDFVVYDTGGHEIPYCMLFTMYGFV